MGDEDANKSLCASDKATPVILIAKLPYARMHVLLL